MNKFKKLNRVKQYYQEEIGVEQYSARLEELSEQMKGSRLKAEKNARVSKAVVQVAQGVQTEPIAVNLRDLSSIDLIRLMNILDEYQKMQLPFQNWLHSPLRLLGNKL